MYLIFCEANVNDVSAAIFLFISVTFDTWSFFPEVTLSKGTNDVAFVKWCKKTIFLFLF